MVQIVLPLRAGPGPGRIVVGNANSATIEALGRPETWPFRTAILVGPPRSGKSLLAAWFAGQGLGEVVDDAPTADETDLFHRWNRAQAGGAPLLLTAPAGAWQITLPDLASRLGAALRLEIGTPDDTMMADLIASHAEARALPLGGEAPAYLAARATRSHMAAERLVAIIDRMSLERKVAPGMGLWREALEEMEGGPQQARLL